MAYNGWMDEIEEDELRENTFESQETVSNEPEVKYNNPETIKIIEAQKNLAEQIEKLKNYEETENVKQAITKSLNVISDLEDVADILEENPYMSIEEASLKAKEPEEEKQEMIDGGKPKSLTLKNPNVPETTVPSVVHDEENNHTFDTGFFKAFVYTAITCGALMGAYMFMLF